MNGGTCTDMINGFKCSCAVGFTGSRCQINIDDCMSQPCRNNGICHDSIAGYTCECPPGYTGKYNSSLHRMSAELCPFLSSSTDKSITYQKSINTFPIHFFLLQEFHVKQILTIVCRHRVIVEFVSMETTRLRANVTRATQAICVRRKSMNVNRIHANSVVNAKI